MTTITKLSHLARVLAASSGSGSLQLRYRKSQHPGHHRGEPQPLRGRRAAANGILIATRADVADLGARDGPSSAARRTGFDRPTPGSPREMMQGPLDPGSRAFGGNHWGEEYAAIRSANDLLAVIGTAAALTAEEQSAVSGFAQHAAGLQLSCIVLDTHTPRTRSRSTWARTSPPRRHRSRVQRRRLRARREHCWTRRSPI